MSVNPLTKLVDVYNVKDKYSKFKMVFIKLGHTLLESVLLSWYCSTGEMRNHQATAAHVDGNTSNEIETLSLYSRESDEATLTLCNFLNKNTDGYVYLPIDGISINYKCGKDILHCKFTNTVHLSDNTRNTVNWSKVHGP